MNVTVFYNSSIAGSATAMWVTKMKYNSATFFDTNGLDGTAISAQITAIADDSQYRVIILSNVVVSAAAAGEMLQSQVDTINSDKFTTAPGADTEALVFPTDNSAVSGIAVNDIKNRPLLTWNYLFPTEDPALLVYIMGRDDYYNIVFQGTASAGAATSITRAGSNLPIDGFSNMYVLTLSGTGSGQIRKILNNSATVLNIEGTWATTPDNTTVFAIIGYVNVQSVIYSAQDVTAGANGTVTVGSAAYTVDGLIGKSVRITAGTGVGQERYVYDNTATVLSVTPNWDTNPDSTSVIDIVEYTWHNISPNIIESAVTATSGGATTINNTAANYPTNVLQGKIVQTVGGTGTGQSRYIASNTQTSIVVTNAWGTQPDNTTEYQILDIGSAWIYLLADQYATLSIPEFYSDVTDVTQIAFMREVLGFRISDNNQYFNPSAYNRTSQNVPKLQEILDKGKTIFEYLN